MPVLRDSWCPWPALPVQSPTSLEGGMWFLSCFPSEIGCVRFSFSWHILLLLLSSDSGLSLVRAASLVEDGSCWSLFLRITPIFRNIMGSAFWNISVRCSFGVLSHLLKQIWYLWEDYLDMCQFLGSRFPNYNVYNKLKKNMHYLWIFIAVAGFMVFVWYQVPHFYVSWNLCPSYILANASSIFPGVTHGSSEGRCLPRSCGK